MDPMMQLLIQRMMGQPQMQAAMGGGAPAPGPDPLAAMMNLGLTPQGQMDPLAQLQAWNAERDSGRRPAGTPRAPQPPMNAIPPASFGGPQIDHHADMGRRLKREATPFASNLGVPGRMNADQMEAAGFPPSEVAATRQQEGMARPPMEPTDQPTWGGSGAEMPPGFATLMPDLELSRAMPGSRSTPGMYPSTAPTSGQYGAAPDGRQGDNRRGPGGMIAEATTPGNPGMNPAAANSGVGMGMDLSNFLMRLGLGMMAAGDQRGATILGALGQGGLAAMTGQQQDKRLDLQERALGARESANERRADMTAAQQQTANEIARARLAQGDRSATESRELRRDETSRREQTDARTFYLKNLELALKPKGGDPLNPGAAGFGLDPDAARLYAMSETAKQYPQSSFGREYQKTEAQRVAAEVKNGRMTREQAITYLRSIGAE